MKQVNLLHTLIMGPTMIYLGTLNKKQLADKSNIGIDGIFYSIITFALFIPFIVRNEFLKIKLSEWNNRNWINFLHYAIFFGLFLYIGTRGRSISKFWQVIALIIGASQIIIHIYYLMLKYKKEDNNHNNKKSA